jgi:hypothetical protein
MRSTLVLALDAVDARTKSFEIFDHRGDQGIKYAATERGAPVPRVIAIAATNPALTAGA